MPADLLQLDSPRRQRRIIEKVRELFVVDRLDFRDDETRSFADFGEQILQLPHAREIFGIRAVFGELERSEVIKALDF